MSRVQTRKSISVTGDLYNRLKEEAVSRGSTQSRIVEDAMRNILGMAERTTVPPLPTQSVPTMKATISSKPVVSNKASTGTGPINLGRFVILDNGKVVDMEPPPSSPPIKKEPDTEMIRPETFIPKIVGTWSSGSVEFVRSTDPADKAAAAEIVKSVTKDKAKAEPVDPLSALEGKEDGDSKYNAKVDVHRGGPRNISFF